MGKSKVYFTNLHTRNNDNLQQKLARLIKKAGIGDIDFTKNMRQLKFISASRGIWLIYVQTTQRP